MTTPRLTRMTVLTSAGAAAAVSAAQAEASASGVPVTVAVVDEAGAIKSLSRMDGAPLISIETATSKAYAAVAIGMPPDEFFEAIKDDPAAVASFATRPGLALIAGGLPVVTDGTVIAGIGVAGAMTGAEDRRIAEHAAAAMAAEIFGPSTPGPGHALPK
jgi:glc operon protein GlcG